MEPKIYEVGIAVDFGMTGSAVAWNEADSPKEIKSINQWPGGNGDKVPTKISLDQFGESVSWGFARESDGVQTKELFKIFLDSTVFSVSEPQKFLDSRPKDSTEAANWSYFYLRSLFGYAITTIGSALRNKLQSADIEVQLRIHCVLTTPTTWDAKTMTTFGFIAERAIDEARKSQIYATSVKTVNVNITEPDAVANYILHSKLASFSHGDNFLVVDVGGATSDSCFCQVAEIYGHQTCLISNREAPIRGISYGCIDIDRVFHLSALKQLHLTRDLKSFDLAMPMRRGKEFQNYKSFYSDESDPPHSASFAIPGWNSTATFAPAEIFQGRMVFAKFNAVLDEALVDRLRKHTSEILSFAPGPLKFLALAGGGSRIAYIRNSLKHMAQILPVPKLDAVAVGCLMKWNRQLLQMTVIVRDTPIQKFAIGTDHRAPGEDVIKHTWRQNTTGKYTTACYIISQDLFQDQGWQQWDIKIEHADLALTWSRNVKKPEDSTNATIRVDLRLPKISPYLSIEDFTAYSPDGIHLPCHASVTLVPAPYPG